MPLAGLIFGRTLVVESLSLQFPAIRAAAARLRVVVAAWHCRLLTFGVVHTLRLLVQGKLLGELGYRLPLSRLGIAQAASRLALLSLLHRFSGSATFIVPRQSGDGYNAGGYCLA